MKEVIIATKNSGKVTEFRELFSPIGLTVRSLLDYPEIADIVEDGETFSENAMIKAETIAKEFNQMVIADDSGLSVDALNGRPGIYSARYAGEEKSDQANIEKVLHEMRDIPSEDRRAAFHCAIAVAAPTKETFVYEGTCKGYIAREAVGANGFGYDPIFYIPELKKTMAELDREEKNQLSHRAAALKLLLENKVDWS